tara:strand:- start:14973 stop:15344 length:372 start_codon:yes stop_codon:yes gene_type:complete
MPKNEDDGFWKHLIISFIILSLIVFFSQFVFASEADDVIKIQSDLIINLEKQVKSQKEINEANEKIIADKEKIMKMQGKHIELQHKDINRLIDEKAKGGDGVVDDIKKQAAIPMFIWILLSLL